MQEYLRSLMAQGKTDKVLQILLKCGPQIKDEDLDQEIILQSGKFEKYAKSKRLGMASSEELQVTLSNIDQAILYIIDQLPPGLSLPNPDSEPKTKKQNQLVHSMIWLGFIIIPLGILAPFIPSIFPTDLTAIVRGPDGEVVLEHNGKLRISFSDENTLTENIGKSGKVHFGARADWSVGKPYSISLSNVRGYMLKNPPSDRVYDGNPILLTVIPDPKLKTVEGRVLNRNNVEMGIGGVDLFVGNEKIGTTSATGHFKIIIDDAQVQEFYQDEYYCTLKFQKEGYKTKTTNYYYHDIVEIPLDLITK